ncbi:hypothetical protein TIFTF001_029697 [Ficus carica]|uniref:Uncharacterized protein n=1 Tax=Ficus carica TaxID=3494 RepID=A0AA88J3P9_FICCA|nr:hypothetical protein TIFTF001_029697 [Ficus carica]
MSYGSTVVLVLIATFICTTSTISTADARKLGQGIGVDFNINPADAREIVNAGLFVADAATGVVVGFPGLGANVELVQANVGIRINPGNGQ